MRNEISVVSAKGAASLSSRKTGSRITTSLMSGVTTPRPLQVMTLAAARTMHPATWAFKHATLDTITTAFAGLMKVNFFLTTRTGPGATHQSVRTAAAFETSPVSGRDQA